MSVDTRAGDFACSGAAANEITLEHEAVAGKVGINADVSRGAR